MLTETEIGTIAETMDTRLGETAIAYAMLQAQWAGDTGDDLRVKDWSRIAAYLDRMHTLDRERAT